MRSRSSRELAASDLWQTPRVRLTILWVGCGWLLALPAFAQPRIDWHASAGCPSSDDGRAQIERLLRAPLAELAVDLSAAVRLRGDPTSGFAATIEVRQDGVARTRALRSADCSVLAHASAVILALAIDPAARIEEPSAPASPQGTPQDASPATTNPSSPSGRREAASPQETASETRPVVDASSAEGVARRPTSVEVTERSETSAPGAAPSADDRTPSAAHGGKESLLEPFLGVALGLNAGSLPKVAPGLALVAGFDTSWSRVALRLTYAPPQRATPVDELPGLAGQVGLFAAAIEAGLSRYFAQLELSALVGFESGMFAARGGTGVSDRETEHPLWLGGYLAGGVALLASASFKVGLRLDGIVALQRPSFVLRSDLGESRTLYRPNLVSGRAWLEFEMYFPL